MNMSESGNILLFGVLFYTMTIVQVLLGLFFCETEIVDFASLSNSKVFSAFLISQNLRNLK